MRGRVAIAAVLFLVATGGAQAAEVPEPFAGWAAEFATPLPPTQVEVVILAGACHGEGLGCTGPGDPIWFDPASGMGPNRWVYAHETGHQFDYQVMPDWARVRFEALVGETRPWTEDPNAPNEKFAEAYAWCALHPRLAKVPLNYSADYRPTPPLQRRVCRMIANVGS